MADVTAIPAPRTPADRGLVHVAQAVQELAEQIVRAASPGALSPLEDAAYRAGQEDERDRWAAALDGAESAAAPAVVAFVTELRRRMEVAA